MDEIDAIMRRLSYKIRLSFVDGHSLLPADEARIADFEDQIGYRLPKEYRYFLQRYQGAWITNVLMYPTVQHENLQGVEGVYALHFLGFYTVPPGQTKSPHDLPWRHRVMKDVLPSGLIPIAEFIQDYYLCISCRLETHGQAYIKVPQDFDDDDPTDFLFFQAPTFLDFLRSLRTLTDEEADEWYKSRGK